jgi:threonine/homoserine/homoserine lactone efflux protein
MAPIAHLSLFFGLVFGIVVLPGMDMAFILASTLAAGRRAGLCGVAGLVAGAVCHVTMGALGVAVILRTSPAAFNLLLVAGALYVAWIGVSLVRQGMVLAPVDAGAASGAATFRRGALTNLLNPKAYVFMLAVFPQFVRPEWGPVWSQAVVLWTIIAVTQTAVYGALVLGAAGSRTWLDSNPRGQRALARGVGALLCGAALVTLVGSWRLH